MREARKHRPLASGAAFGAASASGAPPAALLAALLCLASPALRGQDFDLVAPRTPPAGPGGGIREAEAPEPDAADDAVELLPRLRGLVFVPRTADVREAGRPGVEGVLVEGVPLMDQDEWAARLADRVGAPLTMGGLRRILREVVLHYRGEGRPVVDVVVLEQDVTSGVVQLAVVEASLGEVRAEGAEWFEPGRLVRQVRLEPGGPIDSTLLMADLAWLNGNPFRSVDLLYTPGGGEGETDVVLRIDDRLPLRVYAGGEDSGNLLTGANRWFAGFNYGDLWGVDHQLHYQWTFNDRTGRLGAHALSYVAPLPWRHTASLHAARVESEAGLPAPFDLDGETAQLSGRYAVPLPGRGRLEHELEFGYDFKHSTSNLEFGVLTALATATDVHQFVLGYRARLRDGGGSTGLSAFGHLGPGGFGGGNEDAAFALARAGAESSYAYGRFEAERAQRLPGGFGLHLRATGQLADGNLLPSEQLGLGGHASVRGYEEHELNVDRGHLLSAELLGPPLPLPAPPALAGGRRGELRLLVFVDRGGGRSADPLPGEAGGLSMTSVGPGLRWTVGDRFSLRFDYGFQLEDSGAGLGLGDSRGHLGALLAW